MKKIYAKDYGIVPDTKQDHTLQFQKMLEENKSGSIFLLETGRYDFYSECAIEKEYELSNTTVVPQRRTAVVMEGACGCILDAGGSLFVFHGQIMPFSFVDCTEITLKNVTIDWDIMLSAEGKILSAADTYVDVRIDQDKFPFTVTDNKLVFTGENWESALSSAIEFDAATRKVRYNAGDTFPQVRAQRMSAEVVRLSGLFDPIPKVNNYLVLRHNQRIHAGIFAENSNNLHMENIVMHHSGGLGILCQFCDGLQFHAVQMIPNTDKGNRFVSCHDDGLHLSNNRGSIEVEHCYFYGLMDDAVNVHGTAVCIHEIIDRKTIRGRFEHHQTVGLRRWAQEGQIISFLKKETLESVGTCTAALFTLLSREEFVLLFAEEIPEGIQPMDALENLSNTPEFYCRNNYFGSGRARGILVSTPRKVVIEKNVFETSGSAIVMAEDVNLWYETGACRNVLIQENVFSDSCLTSEYQGCEGVISIDPEIPVRKKELPVHKNIRICRNIFHLFDYPLLYAKAVEHLEMLDNQLIRSYTYEPRHRRRHLVTLDTCRDVRIENNQITGQLLDMSVYAENMDLEEIKSEYVVKHHPEISHSSNK